MDSVTLDSSDVTVVEEEIVAGDVPEALETVCGGMIEVLLSGADGAPGLLVSVDGGTAELGGAVAEESKPGGVGGAGVLLSVAGGVEDSLESGGGTTGTVD